MRDEPFKIIRGDERLTTVSGLAIAGQLLMRTEQRRGLNKLSKGESYKHGNYEVSNFILKSKAILDLSAFRAAISTLTLQY